MNIVADVIMAHLPQRTKTTPSGWKSFNAICCVHNGHKADTRKRGGVGMSGEVISYHCFNCGFKASWQPGRPLSIKLRSLLKWLNVSDNTINKLILEVLRENEGAQSEEHQSLVPTFESVVLPNNSKLISQHSSNSADFNNVSEYIKSRGFKLTDYPFFWSNESKFRDRVIIPYFYQNRIVGYTARSIEKQTKYKYINEQQPGYVFNLDNQTYEKSFAIACEGPIDALHVNGVGLLGSEIHEQQAMLLNRLYKQIIVVPDRDFAGKKLVNQALELNYSVSMPDWDADINDIGDAVLRYGKLYTLYSIVDAAETSQLKIKLKAKKWFTLKE